MGCIVPVWLHLFAAKFIWHLQKCVHLADPVWYCITEEFLVITMAQTVMNNSFTIVLRISSTIETFLYLFFSLLSFPLLSLAITWCLAMCSGNCWLESLYGGLSCHFNDTGTKSNYRFLCRIPFIFTLVSLLPVSIPNQIPLLVHFQPGQMCFLHCG